MNIRTTALTIALTATLGTGIASADAIDNALAKLPSGPISCEQASRYWTNDADFNAKKNQANTIAMFDRRGPQIQAALGRVEEAVDRCGLRGTTGNNKPAAPAAPAKPTTPAAPAKPASPTPSLPVITVAPANVPTFDMPVANALVLRLPDLSVIVQELLAKNGSSLPF